MSVKLGFSFTFDIAVFLQTCRRDEIKQNILYTH